MWIQVVFLLMVVSRLLFMFMDRVFRLRFRFSSSLCRWVNVVCCVVCLVVGLGMVIRLCNWRLGSCFMVLVRVGRFLGVQLDLLVLLLMLICRQIFRGGSLVGCCFDRCCVIFNWFIECIYWKCLVMGCVLFDWMGLMKCQFKGRLVSLVCLLRVFCRQFLLKL